jgi:tetratricopeptide (TPR) repeat protein
MEDSDSATRKSFLIQMEPYFERNEAQAALELARNRLEQNPEDLYARIVICRAWFVQGRIGEAKEMLAEIEEILFGVARLYECIGDLYKKKGLEKEANTFYQKSGALAPKSSLADMGKMPDTFEESAGLEAYDHQAEERDNEGIPSGFETVTIAELYMQQGHYQMAEEMLVKMITRDATNDRVAGLLKDVRDRLSRGQSHLMNGEIIKELSKWLDNMGSLRRHAG